MGEEEALCCSLPRYGRRASWNGMVTVMVEWGKKEMGENGCEYCVLLEGYEWKWLCERLFSVVMVVWFMKGGK